MGLDAVELLMAFEDEFGVHIADAEAAQMATPGDVAHFLLSRLRQRRTDACPSQRGFYRLRRALKDALGVDRALVRPDSELTPFLSRAPWSSWVALERSVGVDTFPRLKRSPLLFMSTVVGLPLVAAGYLMFAGARPMVVVCSTALVAAIANLASGRFGSRVPDNVTTVAGLIPYIESRDSSIWAHESVLERVIHVTGAQLGVPPEKIHEDSLFVADLGVG